jgi:hypothetical protein
VSPIVCFDLNAEKKRDLREEHASERICPVAAHQPTGILLAVGCPSANSIPVPLDAAER